MSTRAVTERIFSQARSLDAAADDLDAAISDLGAAMTGLPRSGTPLASDIVTTNGRARAHLRQAIAVIRPAASSASSYANSLEFVEASLRRLLVPLSGLGEFIMRNSRKDRSPFPEAISILRWLHKVTSEARSLPTVLGTLWIPHYTGSWLPRYSGRLWIPGQPRRLPSPGYVLVPKRVERVPSVPKPMRALGKLLSWAGPVGDILDIVAVPSQTKTVADPSAPWEDRISSGVGLITTAGRYTPLRTFTEPFDVGWDIGTTFHKLPERTKPVVSPHLYAWEKSVGAVSRLFWEWRIQPVRPRRVVSKEVAVDLYVNGGWSDKVDGKKSTPEQDAIDAYMGR